MSSNLGFQESVAHRARLDAVGIFYLTACSLWTLLLLCGMLFLWHKRRMPFLRIRHLKLTFSATLIIHLHWIFIQIGYTLGPLIPEEVDYWLMGVLYPLGIGLFVAGNSQLLHIAKLQEEYVRSNGSIDLRGASLQYQSSKGVWKRTYKQFQQLDFSLKALLVVCAGMTAEASIKTVKVAEIELTK